MKFHGKKVEGPKPRVFFLARGGEEEYKFIASVVTDFTEFDDKVARPKPPLVSQRGKKPYHDVEDRDYNRALDTYATTRMAWLVITSLKDTPGMEWEIVDYNDPETWTKYEEELKTSFADFEVAYIINEVMAANSIDEDRQREAMERFTLSQAEAAKASSTSQKAERASTPSGEPANDSESDRQESQVAGTK